jgi:hypothetical protein
VRPLSNPFRVTTSFSPSDIKPLNTVRIRSIRSEVYLHIESGLWITDRDRVTCRQGRCDDLHVVLTLLKYTRERLVWLCFCDCLQTSHQYIYTHHDDHRQRGDIKTMWCELGCWVLIYFVLVFVSIAACQALIYLLISLNEPVYQSKYSSSNAFSPQIAHHASW